MKGTFILGQIAAGQSNQIERLWNAPKRNLGNECGFFDLQCGALQLNQIERLGNMLQA